MMIQMPDEINSHAGLTMTFNGLHVIDGLMVVASPLLVCPVDVSAMMDTTDVLTYAAMRMGAVMRWPACYVVRMPTASLC